MGCDRAGTDLRALDACCNPSLPLLVAAAEAKAARARETEAWEKGKEHGEEARNRSNAEMDRKLEQVGWALPRLRKGCCWELPCLGRIVRCCNASYVG